MCLSCSIDISSICANKEIYRFKRSSKSKRALIRVVLLIPQRLNGKYVRMNFMSLLTYDICKNCCKYYGYKV